MLWRCTGARLSITVDPKLVEEARQLAGARTKREAVEQARREFARHRQLAKLADLEGSGLAEFDPEALHTWRRTATPPSNELRTRPTGFLGVDSLPSPHGGELLKTPVSRVGRYGS